jgi:hypothetical protein|tara:strand:+ start:575 stop:889 length:315 start_codon:yes stop_codon:yes gene_type:complete
MVEECRSIPSRSSWRASGLSESEAFLPLDGRGQEKVPISRSFHQDADSGAVVIEDLEALAPLVGEDEKRAGLETLFLKGIGDDHESLKGFAHIAGIQCDEDPQV